MPLRKILAVALLIPITSHAEGLARPISYFMTHPAEMRQTIIACEDNSQLANTATCVNAQPAAAGLRARNAPDLVGMLSDPRYWSANPIARDGELVNCRNGTSMLPQFCGAAVQSAQQDLQKGSR